MASVQLYGLDLSHYVVKAKRILAYKRIPYEFVYAPYHDRQELLKVSGQDFVPFLFVDGKPSTWAEIPARLEALQPSPTLFPGNNVGLAHILESWAHDVVEEAAWRMVAPDARKTFKDPREAWVFEELQMRKRGDLDEMAVLKPKYTAGLVSTLQPAEQRLKEAPFLLGEAPSLADFALYGALHCIPFTGNSIPKELPATNAWFAKVGALGK